MATKLLYFLSICIGVLLLAGAAWAAQPTPTPAPSGWFGIANLIVSSPGTDLKKNPVDCTYQVLNEVEAQIDCSPITAEGVDWSQKVASGQVAADFTAGPGTEYLRVTYQQKKTWHEGREYRELLALPDDGTGNGTGGSSSSGPTPFTPFTGTYCSTSNTTGAQQNSINQDQGTNGVGWQSYHSCPRQNEDVNSCYKFYTNGMCYCTNTYGNYLQFRHQDGTLDRNPGKCSNLNGEYFYTNGTASIQ